MSYLQEFIDIREKIKKGDSTWDEVLKLREKYHKPSLSKDTIRKGVLFFDEFNNENWITQPEKEGQTVITKELINNGEQIISEKIISLNENDVQDSNAILKAHGYDPNEFDLVSAKNSQWQQSSKNGTKNLYSSKITVKRNKNKLNYEEIKKYFENYKIEADNYNTEYTNYSKNGKSLIICLYDLHFARYCYNDETGESYDINLAKQRIKTNIRSYIQKFKGVQFKEIVLPIGQDYFNSASTGFTSSGKHKQDNCVGFREMFIKGTELLIDIIYELSILAPVKVIGVEGNHAKDEEFAMFQVISARFFENSRVDVNNGPSSRKYYSFGKNCIGFTHGHNEKERLYGLMQIEQPTIWANTTNHMWLTGHLHHLAVEEKNGVENWCVPAICGNDSWTYQKGYASKKRTMGFILDIENGLEEVHFINL